MVDLALGGGGVALFCSLFVFASSFLQLKAKKSAGHISAYSKASLPCSPAARTTSAVVTPDISELEAGSEKGRENPVVVEICLVHKEIAQNMYLSAAGNMR